MRIEWKPKLTDIKPSMSGPELRSYLDGFDGGSDIIYGHWTKAITYTVGVKAMAQFGGAFWMIDAIASHQPKCLKDPMLRDFQLWTLEWVPPKPAPGKASKIEDMYDLCCYRDKGDLAFAQRIEYTDFPIFEGFKLYVENAVLKLPGER